MSVTADGLRFNEHLSIKRSPDEKCDNLLRRLDSQRQIKTPFHERKENCSLGFLPLADTLMLFSDSCIPTSLMQATDYLYCINGHFSKVVAIITVLKIS